MALSSRVLTPIVLAASLVLLPICSPTAAKVSAMTLARETSWASACETCSLIFCAIEFGAVGEPPLDFADLIGDPCGSRVRPLGHALVRRCKGLLDGLCAFGELGRALVRAGDDLLLGIAENACDVCRAGNELLLGLRRRRRQCRPCVRRASSRRRRTRRQMSPVRAPSASALSPTRAAIWRSTESKTLARSIAREPMTSAVSLTRSVRRWSACSKLRTISLARAPSVASLSEMRVASRASAASKMRAKFGRAGGQRFGRFTDARGQALVGIVEIAQDIAGPRGKR